MGRLTEFLDYMSRKSEDFSSDFIKANYTHFTITEEDKEIRKREKWYKDEQEAMPQELSLF